MSTKIILANNWHVLSLKCLVSGAIIKPMHLSDYNVSSEKIALILSSDRHKRFCLAIKTAKMSAYKKSNKINNPLNKDFPVLSSNCFTQILKSILVRKNIFFNSFCFRANKTKEMTEAPKQNIVFQSRFWKNPRFYLLAQTVSFDNRRGRLI